MTYLIDFFFGRETTRDELGYRGGNPHFNPPRPPVQPGQVFYGVRVGDGRDSSMQQSGMRGAHHE